MTSGQHKLLNVLLCERQSVGTFRVDVLYKRQRVLGFQVSQLLVNVVAPPTAES